MRPIFLHCKKNLLESYAEIKYTHTHILKQDVSSLLYRNKVEKSSTIKSRYLFMYIYFWHGENNLSIQAMPLMFNLWQRLVSFCNFFNVGIRLDRGHVYRCVANDRINIVMTFWVCGFWNVTTTTSFKNSIGTQFIYTGCLQPTPAWLLFDFYLNSSCHLVLTENRSISQRFFFTFGLTNFFTSTANTVVDGHRKNMGTISKLEFGHPQ